MYVTMMTVLGDASILITFLVRAIDCAIFSQSQLLMNNCNCGVHKPRNSLMFVIYDFWIVQSVIKAEFKQKCYLKVRHFLSFEHIFGTAMNSASQ